jgi:rfaE bifunctional protein nucleotidyltransferase chain/domain
LVVGVNSDRSVARLKGPGRPFLPEGERCLILSALREVDHVLVFDDPLPNAWLAQVQPDLHCKAADYTAENLPEAAVVRTHGGDVRILPLQSGQSTSRLVGRITASTKTAQGEDCAPGGLLDEMLDISNTLRQAAYRLHAEIRRAAELMAAALLADGTILVCGDDESLAAVQYFASALTGPFRRNHPGAVRPVPLPPDDRSVDVGPRDLLVVLAVAGDARDVLRAVSQAKRVKGTCVAIIGTENAAVQSLADVVLVVPAREVSMIQRIQVLVLHVLNERVERYARDPASSMGDRLRCCQPDVGRGTVD